MARKRSVSKSKAKVKGWDADAVRHAMDMFGEDIKIAVGEAIKESADEVLATAKSKAPFKTGQLREGIIIQNFRTRNDELVVWDVGMDPAMNDVFRQPILNPSGKRTNSYYPTVMEYGTPRIPARPFLRPALKAHRASTKRAVAARVKGVVRRDY